MANMLPDLQLTYRLVKDTDEDFADFYKIKCDPENIKWSGFTSAPERISFRSWFSTQIKNPHRDIYLVYTIHKSGGAVRMCLFLHGLARTWNVFGAKRCSDRICKAGDRNMDY